MSRIKQIGNPYGKLSWYRNSYGIPVIEAENEAAMYYGQGWMHMHDRQLQSCMLKVLLSGHAAEHFGESLVDVDRYMLRFPFLRNPEEEVAKIPAEDRKLIDAYIDGVNHGLRKKRWEWRLTGYVPENWKIDDVIRNVNGFGFVGLADSQGAVEKFIIEMIRGGIDEKRIKELFPNLTEPLFVSIIKQIKNITPNVPLHIKWMNSLPTFLASNNWAVSGKLTGSGKAILAGDPHLQIDRLPAIWYEMEMKTCGRIFKGFTVPGIMGCIVGRNNSVSWSPTYSFLDSLDYRIENIKGNEYQRESGWKPVEIRNETIKVKNKEPVNETYYETDQGLVEGKIDGDGYYLVQNYSVAFDCGSKEMSAIINLFRMNTVAEGMEIFKKIDSASFNWVLADNDGHIGMQMSGRMVKRPEGVSGLAPLPAWEDRYLLTGFVSPDELTNIYDPDYGVIVTANNDMNNITAVPVTSISMASYRADRISRLINDLKPLDKEKMQRIQNDIYSIEAEEFMKVIEPYLPDNEKGNILRNWDRCYDSESTGAILFESVYRELIIDVFGRSGMGVDVIDYILNNTNLMVLLFGYFDDILLEQSGYWFDGKTREKSIKNAVEKGLEKPVCKFKMKRKMVMKHILFGGLLPGFLGFDYGPVFFPGSRATVLQGQFFNYAGRQNSFCPSMRLIADMGEDTVLTGLMGGVTDRRFSKWYRNEVEDFINGKYKEY